MQTIEQGNPNLMMSSKSRQIQPVGKLPEIKRILVDDEDDDFLGKELNRFGNRINSVSKPSLMQLKNLNMHGMDMNGGSRASAVTLRPSNAVTHEASPGNSKRPCENCGKKFSAQLLELHSKNCTLGVSSAVSSSAQRNIHKYGNRL